MDFRVSLLFIVSLVFFSRARAEGDGTVFFVDGSINRYIRTMPSDDVVEASSILLPEVSAAVSILLGLAPPSTLSAASSSQLNEVLIPHPFDRPRAVFTLEISGIDDPKLFFNQDIARFSGAHPRKLYRGSEEANIQFSEEDEVSFVSLNEPLVDYTDKDVSEFASWIGGSYIADALIPLNGELIVSLANGIIVNLHMEKKADREFVSSILCFIYNMRRAMNIHEDMSKSVGSPAELITGYFDGVKDLQEKYGSEAVTQQGAKLFLATLSKIFDLLQKTYKGEIVGVIIFSGTSQSELDKAMNVIFNSRPRPTPRWLVESESAKNSTLAEVMLVRRTIAWVTGIILLIATLVAIYLLMGMPLTKDTLLYSNVKLD